MHRNPYKIIQKFVLTKSYVILHYKVYNYTKVPKFSTYSYHYGIMSFQELKNNGNICTYHKAKDHVVVLTVPESYLI